MRPPNEHFQPFIIINDLRIAFHNPKKKIQVNSLIYKFYWVVILANSKISLLEDDGDVSKHVAVLTIYKILLIYIYIYIYVVSLLVWIIKKY
jgi:hypothetical protein